MGTHRGNQFAISYEKGLVHIYARVDIGASGAPSLVAKYNQGIKSVVRNSAGDYTVTFGAIGQAGIDKYQRLMAFRGVVSNATASAVIAVQPLADATAAGSMEVVCVSASGVPADPESGSELLLHFVVKNSTVV
jgi:hypothetical protein